ncbi:prepilin-type N-terminal cleavage/methylation domain-containing protein [Desulfonatronum zhilinae]|nr:prepilin-type N-terminal cleavage/methylation domain-containing protein [Desulfonatronum zhilinae]
MLKRKMNRKKGQLGFTLLEILVVVAIMGFLVAMVAPRFAGITDGTIDVVCDTNQQRLISVLAAFNEQKGTMPGGMVNLVDEEGPLTAGIAAEYLRPTHTGELEFPDEGQATFFEEFFERNLFQVHILDADEAAELRAMGVGSVYNLNAYNYEGLDSAAGYTVATDQQNPLRRVGVNENLGVLMVGMGYDGAAWAGPVADATAAGLIEVDGEGYGSWGNPDWFGRIILGVGPDSDLIKQGMISAAGLCPGGINNEQVFWNNYNVLLPRLQATIDRYATGQVTGLLGKSNGGSYRAFDLTEAQEGYMFLTQCPEGHRFATADEFTVWGVYAYADIDDVDLDSIPAALETLEVND